MWINKRIFLKSHTCKGSINYSSSSSSIKCWKSSWLSPSLALAALSTSLVLHWSHSLRFCSQLILGISRLPFPQIFNCIISCNSWYYPPLNICPKYCSFLDFIFFILFLFFLKRLLSRNCINSLCINKIFIKCVIYIIYYVHWTVQRKLTKVMMFVFWYRCILYIFRLRCLCLYRLLLLM